MPNYIPDTAMVFAAGFGKRMLPITKDIPKPLVKVAGRTLLDHVLDSLARVGVNRAVINTHYLAEKIESYVKGRESPKILISHEPNPILETGGGVVKALSLLGDKPFYIINTDTLCVDNKVPALLRLSESWDPEKMDALLLLAKVDTAVGYDGNGDFELLENGLVSRIKSDSKNTYVYAGVLIIKPEVFEGKKIEPFSLFGDFIFKEPKYNSVDGSMPRIHGLVHDGKWLHVGTPEAILMAEEALNT